VEADCAWLNYWQRQRGGEWSAMRYPVAQDRTACNYGGSMFACRRCQRLTYRCQRETPDDGATRQADKLRDRLGGEAGILNGNGGKPKGMHWRTFERLDATHDRLVNHALGRDGD